LGRQSVTGGNQQALTGIFELPRIGLLARNNFRIARDSIEISLFDFPEPDF
jgi:hypothetical protein